MLTARVTALPLTCACGQRYAIGVTMKAPTWMEPSPEPQFTLPDNCSRCGEPLDTYENVADLTCRAFLAVQP